LLTIFSNINNNYSLIPKLPYYVITPEFEMTGTAQTQDNAQPIVQWFTSELQRFLIIL
jgi:hypothetical protein